MIIVRLIYNRRSKTGRTRNVSSVNVDQTHLFKEDPGNSKRKEASGHSETSEINKERGSNLIHSSGWVLDRCGIFRLTPSLPLVLTSPPLALVILTRLPTPLPYTPFSPMPQRSTTSSPRHNAFVGTPTAHLFFLRFMENIIDHNRLQTLAKDIITPRKKFLWLRKNIFESNKFLHCYTVREKFLWFKEISWLFFSLI